MFREPLDVHSLSLVLSNFQSFTRSLNDWNEEILHLLIVDLQHRYVHFVLAVLVGIGMHPPKYLLAADWHNSLVGTVADHRIALS